MLVRQVKIPPKVTKNFSVSSGNNSSSYKFAEHLNSHMHMFRPIDNITQVLYYQKKGTHLEILCIHKEASSDNQLTDKHTIGNP